MLPRISAFICVQNKLKYFHSPNWILAHFAAILAHCATVFGVNQSRAENDNIQAIYRIFSRVIVYEPVWQAWQQEIWCDEDVWDYLFG